MIAGSKFSEWQMRRPWHIRAARLQSGPKLVPRLCMVDPSLVRMSQTVPGSFALGKTVLMIHGSRHDTRVSR